MLILDSLCLLETKPQWFILFYMPYWIGLYFSQFAQSVCQILSPAAELCKAILDLVNSKPRLLYLRISVRGFQCPSDTSCVQVYRAFTSQDLIYIT